MEAFSDSGYGYLGDLLASRGFVVVSVDENFLNSSASDLITRSPLWTEGARAVLLLEHLSLWREWNASADSPFAGKVDMERIALVGHSRGGEAVAVAAVFNGLPRFPDDARITFDYGFGIRSVVAIAPVDGLYRPAAVGTPLENLSYFTLHGTHDGEVPSFYGSRQYQRVTFSDGGDGFKAGLYVHRANHAQFNSTWEGDLAGLSRRFLNVTPVLPRSDQEQIAKVFISAFLEATLNDEPGYRALFQDYRVGAAWLPDVALMQQYEDARTHLLATYEEDLDVCSTTAEGGEIQADGLTDWKERRVNLKWEPLETRGVTLGWNRSTTADPAWYALTLPVGFPVTRESVLTFHLADARREPSPPLRGDGSGQRESARPTPAQDGGIDFTVELEDATGTTTRVPLSHVSALRRQIEAQVPKGALLTNAPRSEVVFQVYSLPLASFEAENPTFEPETLRTIRLVFDRTQRGVVILDDVGLR